MNAPKKTAILIQLENGLQYVFRKRPSAEIYWESSDSNLKNQEGKLIQMLDSAVGTPLSFLFESAGVTYYNETVSNIKSYEFIQDINAIN